MTDQATPTPPTPENTPLPGGGSWRWDDAVPGWVPNAAHTALPEPEAALATEPTTPAPGPDAGPQE